MTVACLGDVAHEDCRTVLIFDGHAVEVIDFNRAAISWGSILRIAEVTESSCEMASAVLEPSCMYILTTPIPVNEVDSIWSIPLTVCDAARSVILTIRCSISGADMPG